MDYIIKNVIVPDEINTKLNEINLLIYKSKIDINTYLSKLFMSEEFAIKVFHRKLSITDWEIIYHSLNSEIGKEKFKNNGILFEHFCNKIISEHFNLKNLVNFGGIDFQDPEKGTDIIFINENFKLQFYEVKSRSTKSGKGNESNLASLIKKAIISTFCSKLKNVVKLVNAKTEIKTIPNCDKSYNLLTEMLKNNELINYVDNENIDFNICIIGEEFEIEEKLFEEKIIELFNTTKDCDPNCKFNDVICKKNILDRIKILNIINVQFMGELSLQTIYKKIIEDIELMGVLNNEE